MSSNQKRFKVCCLIMNKLMNWMIQCQVKWCRTLVVLYISHKFFLLFFSNLTLGFKNLTVYVVQDYVHTHHCSYCIEECVELCLRGCSHSQKPLMVIHHKEDCQFSQGTVGWLFLFPVEKNENAEIQVSASPAARLTQSQAWFHRGMQWVCSWLPVNGKVFG